MTRCECTIPDGGWCERHKMRKTAGLVHVCQTNADYFDVWENFHRQEAIQSRPGPSVIQMAWNFTEAIAQFAADVRTHGLHGAFVDRDEYRRRLEICDQCIPPSGYRLGNRCSHQACGCFLVAKARGRAWRCPVGKWD